MIEILYVKQSLNRRKTIVKKLVFMKSQTITRDSEALKDLEELLEVRFEFRNSMIEIIHSCVRMMMLWKSLRFPGHKGINPVTGAAIGYLSTMLGLFKTLFESPQLMVKTIEEEVKDHSEKGDLLRSMSSVFNFSAVSTAGHPSPDPIIPHNNQQTDFNGNKFSNTPRQLNSSRKGILARTFSRPKLYSDIPEL